MAYRTIQNDCFDAIAFRQWGEEKYMRLLVEANPDYADVLLFHAGQTLAVPEFEPPAQSAPDLPPWY